MTNMTCKERQELILVVDDDPGVKDLTRDILQRYGHNVLTAGNGGEALSLCEQRGTEISVVLLDATVSEPLAGNVFQRILKANPSAKVIVTSAYSHNWFTSDIFGQGAAGFLRKPYRMTELLRIVERVQEMQ